MLTIMKFPSSPYEKLHSRKICKFGEKATVPKVPLPRVGKWLIHRTALFYFPNYYSFIPSSVHKQRAHSLLHYPLIAMTLYKKADRGLFLYWTQTKSTHSPATEKLQKHTLQEKLSSFGPSGEQARMRLKSFTKAANVPFSLSFTRVCEEELALDTIAERLQLVLLTTLMLMCRAGMP